MKKLILLSVFLFICSLSFGQGTSYNLGFNQVLLVSSIDTVPVGKTWKITNVMPSDSYNFAVALNIKINSNVIRMGARDFSVGTSTSPRALHTWQILNGAIWLPAGTTLETHDNCEYISVIEFNIE